MNKISIGILTYQRIDDLLETLSCLNKTRYNLELVLLNNNVEEDVQEVVENLIDEKITLNYIWDKVNYGVSKGRRILVEKASCKYMILLDDDIYIEDINKIVENVLDEFSKNLLLGGIAFNIKQFKDGIHNKYEIPHKNKRFNMEAKQPTYLMIGAGHAINISLAREVGNYPDDFGLYGLEEVYLAFNMINMGYGIIYLPNCEVLHKKSPDGRFSNKKVNYLTYKNRMTIACRHFKIRYIISCLIVRSLYFLLKNRSFNELVSVVADSLAEYKEKRSPYSNEFYKKIKELKGFLWY